MVLWENKTINKEPILSICIASYNHGKELYDKINLLLKIEQNLEIVCSDNASSDETDELLSSVKNNNFHYIKNERNMGLTVNYINALDHAKGKYALFLTDKDSINTKRINDIITLLKNRNFSMGYFVFDSNSNDLKINYFKDQKSCLKMFAYLSKHPSGYFFNNELMKKINIKKYADTTVSGVFPYLSAPKHIDKARGQVFNIGGGIENSLSLLELFTFLEKELNVKMHYTQLAWRLGEKAIKKFLLPILKKQVKHLNGSLLCQKNRVFAKC